MSAAPAPLGSVPSEFWPPWTGLPATVTVSDGAGATATAVASLVGAAATAGDPGRRRSLVRKWFAAITLLLASLALLGDLVAVVNALLEGELTGRFVAKALLIAVIGGLAFAYYRDELDDR